MLCLITGTTKKNGLGMAAAKQLAQLGHQVLLNTRDEKKTAEVKSWIPGSDCLIFDVRDHARVKAEIENAVKLHGPISVLINNAGVYLDDPATDTLTANAEVILDSFQINSIGALNCIQAVLPQMKKNNFGRIVNVSSGMGQLSEMNGGYHGYRMSKTALNALTRIVADENLDWDFQINSMCPGWCRTEMGGENAHLSPEDGADTMVWLATRPQAFPSGFFYREREKIDW